MNTTIMGLTTRALLGRRRVLMLLPMPLVLIGLTLIAVSTGAQPENWGPLVFGGLGLAVILPLTALIVGSSVLGLEIDDGTITHLLTKPLPRSEIVMSKLCVAWLVTTIATGMPLAISALIAGSGQLAIGLAAGALLGSLTYTALFLALSLITKRPVAVGLVYIMLWENLVVGFVDGAKVFSVQQHATTFANAVAQSDMLNDTVALPTAMIIAAIFVVVGTWGATARLRSFALTGEAN
ncbi:ABC transporter permease [Actinophytocola sediminis]